MQKLRREWTPAEDLVLGRLIREGSTQDAADKLARPIEAIRLRLQFLEDHEITVVNGSLVHRRTIHQVVGPLRDPLRYHSALGQDLMHSIKYQPLSALLKSARSKGAKDDGE